MISSNGNGAVVFIEDVDEVLSKRNSITNEISIIMDGSETKHNNLITIFSTNHIEKIDPTFLRGKRIGSIVTLEHLDKDTAERMIRFHFGDDLKGDIDKACEQIEESRIVPAFLAEIIDRVKTHCIITKTSEVTEKQLLSAIKQYQRQIDVARVRVENATPEQKIVSALGEMINPKVSKVVDNIIDGVIENS